MSHHDFLCVAHMGKCKLADTLVPRLTVGIFRGYLGISGDLKGQFLPLIKSLILIIMQSYADLCVQETEIFLTTYNTYSNNQRHKWLFNVEVRIFVFS
jgi:hypothetical protein